MIPKRRNLIRALETEGLGGWQLFEKLDDGRLRMRRVVSERLEDNMRPSGYDPYRIQHGVSEEGLAGIVVGAMIAIGLIAFAIINLV